MIVAVVHELRQGAHAFSRTRLGPAVARWVSDESIAVEIAGREETLDRVATVRDVATR
jgi:hypothetical protein